MHDRLLTRKNSSKNSIQWFATLLFCWIPLLLLESDSGLSTIEIAVALTFVLILAIWIIKLIMQKKSINWRPLDIPILLFFGFITFYFVKVINGTIDFEDWLTWRKFFFLLVYFPISTQFNNIYRLRALVCSLLFVGF